MDRGGFLERIGTGPVAGRDRYGSKGKRSGYTKD